MRYIWRMDEYGMTFQPSQNSLQLISFVDANWGYDLDK
jgi:hypothetical protein